MSDSSRDSLFNECIDAIKSTILPAELESLRRYADVNALVQDMRALCATRQNENQRLLHCTKKIALFAHAFAPYFDMVNLFVELDPNWIAWFWGLLGLVFKVGSDHALFLERTCDVYKVMAHALPQYRQIHDSNKDQIQAEKGEHLALMSHVYADIIQFNLELYCMFSCSSQGAKLRHRFGVLSENSLWRPLDSRFTQLQQHFAKQTKWLEAITPLSTSPQDHSILLQHQRDYFDYLNFHPESQGEIEAKRMGRRMRRIARVKAWISDCCAYRDIYDLRARQRHPKTCSWFLSALEYCQWKNAPFDRQRANNDWHERVLFVQATPGFGKTFLADCVIDDLSTEAEDLNISDEPPSTIFFHFNSAHLYCTEPGDALRALATQLVHIHRHDRSTLDALSLLMRKTPSQELASSNDVLEVLSLLLRQHPTFLVIDGVDECVDSQLFLSWIPELCRKSDARVIFFSRPTIEIPLQYQKWDTGSPHIITLNETQNAHDIDLYLNENLNQLADQGYFGASMDRSLITSLASRSQGDFLWAGLLMKYLSSPDVSPDERRASLQQAHLLEGTESLYRLILIGLDRKAHGDKRVVADTFRWLAFSIKRLCIPKLQTALTIGSGHGHPANTRDTNLSNLAESLPRLTCGLVEVTNSTVLFFHRSTKVYLQSIECQDSMFSLFDESAAHGHLAARCLSYLANDIPKRPLQRLQPYIRPTALTTPSGLSIRTGSSRDSGYKSMSSASDTEASLLDPSTSQTPTFDLGMPFLRYAALCWPVHLTRALSTLTPAAPRAALTTEHTSSSFAHTPWLPVLSQFLTDRIAVTTWVEASWRYHLPPNLARLIPLLLSVKSEMPPATIEGREVKWVVQGLRQLSEALTELRDEYGASLGENASLIWQWNIQAATVGFWPVWDERRGGVHGA
ncbi:hypothetical protein K491DRAFT_718890 [Lophiostoma macrostomum CBS 122681]|uniref:Nephrocystin 3-like N-terminal domain-containing protein n=1 Tax=Lophiostoma macrostomum CBS 122681 TaxID=1314788 RepID=A0A6A6SY43_9PLEO|nr:hypothetical protein K491DRAFT_718890 [Lophiostoma macrostomum CBS 122681]